MASKTASRKHRQETRKRREKKALKEQRVIDEKNRLDQLSANETNIDHSSRPISGHIVEVPRDHNPTDHIETAQMVNEKLQMLASDLRNTSAKEERKESMKRNAERLLVILLAVGTLGAMIIPSIV